MKKIFSLILLVALSLFLYAHDFEEHQKELSKVLFGTDYTFLPEKEKEKFFILSNAAYLAIDSFNNNGSKQLEFLKNHGVKNLPELRQIDYSASGNTHQEFTHRGWNHDYSTDKAHWQLRKQIMLNSAKKVFGENYKVDSLCALIYYAHILGDHEGDKITTSHTRMALGGRSDNYDITSMLSGEGRQSDKIIPMLFDNSHGSTLSYELKAINKKIDKLLRENPDGTGPRRELRNLSDKEYRIYQGYSKEILNLLSRRIHEMWKFEPWFTKAFPNCR